MSRAARPLAAAALTLGVFAAALAVQSNAPPKATAESPAAPPPAAAPRYWKGNLHTHSLWSDGDDFPEMIADWYKTHGYNFLALTEHNVIAEGDKWVDAAAGKGPRAEAVAKYVAKYGTGWVERRERDGKPEVRLKTIAEFAPKFNEPGKFLMVPGEEISHSYAKRPIHMNAVNLRGVIKPVDGGSVGETISVNMRQVADQKAKTGQRMAVFLNHPNFRWGVTAEDMLEAANLGAFEVFNGHPGVANFGDDQHAGTERVWDIVLAVRLGRLGLPPVWGLATDDSHAYHAWGLGKTNPGRGWVMVRAADLSGEAVAKALETGDFYASSGVELTDVSKAGGEFKLAIRGEPGVTYKTQFVATMKDAKLDSTAVAGPDGKPLPAVTRAYGPEVGKVVAEQDGVSPAYKLTGNELYVRAKVTSSKPHPNPYAKGDTECAWTQPVRP